MIKIIEVIKYGDFDMPYTHSIWYKELPDGEIGLNKKGLYETEMAKDFKKLTGLKIEVMGSGFKIHEDFQANLFTYLNARGYKKAKTTIIKLHD